MSSFDSLLRMTVPQESEKIVISRYWDNPKITVTVNKDKITVVTSMEDFLKALCEELEMPEVLFAKAQNPEQGKSAWMWIKSLYPRSFAMTHEDLKHNIMRAARRTLEKIKEATSQVM